MGEREYAEDASLPAQYWASWSSRALTPDKRLLLAVLQDALKRYRALVHKGGRPFAEVTAWFAADDIDFTFSFLSICDALRLSPSRIRRSLYAPDGSRQRLKIKWRGVGNTAWSRIAPQSGHVADSATPLRAKIISQL
jgi:hypothetical protein